MIKNDSFFKEIYDLIFHYLTNEKLYDNVLVDIFKISNEKFVIDQVIFSVFFINFLTFLCFYIFSLIFLFLIFLFFLFLTF